MGLVPEPAPEFLIRKLPFGPVLLGPIVFGDFQWERMSVSILRTSCIETNYEFS
jgi:hypothetical protein